MVTITINTYYYEKTERILKNHSINTKWVGAELFAEQVCTNNGLTFSEWLKVDTEKNKVGDEDLMDWLGY
jgi:hypothetical protein